jgi:tetratricopeptide (TPR) repeat protein
MEPAPEPSLRAHGAAGLALAALVGVAVLAALFAGDGSDVGGILPVGGGAVVLLAGVAVAIGLGRLPAPRLGRSGAALVGSLVGLVAWIGVTIAWSIAPDRSWDVFNRAVAFAAFLGLGLVLGAAARTHAARIWGFLLAGALAATLLWALLGEVVPSLDPEGELVARLNEPVDYWNALALLADVALVLGLWLAVSRAHRLAIRVAGGLLVYVAALALALTLSRVGVIAGVAVLALWLALAEERVEGALVLAAAGAPAVLVAGWAFTRPALVEAGASYDDRVADGAVFGVLAAAGAIVALALVLVALRRQVQPPGRARATRGLVVLGAVVAVSGVLVAAVAVGNAIASGRSCAEVANAPSRLGSLDLNSRWCWWNEAWDVFVGHAPEGAGAGTFEIARKRYREDARAVREPHSVPLRQLADGGVVGLALFLALVAAAAAACVCAVRRLEGAERTAAIALVAAPAAYFVHALVDYEWDFIATTGPVLVTLGVLATAGRPLQPRRPGGGIALMAGAVALALTVLVSFAAPSISERSVRASTRALIDGDLESARDHAERARSWNPLAVEPLVALARVEQRDGNLDGAERRFVDAVELQPENPETWYALGIFELEVRDDPCSAYRFLNEAYTRDPAGRQWFPGGPLDVARDAVNAGACVPG